MLLLIESRSFTRCDSSEGRGKTCVVSRSLVTQVWFDTRAAGQRNLRPPGSSLLPTAQGGVASRVEYQGYCAAMIDQVGGRKVNAS